MAECYEKAFSIISGYSQQLVMQGALGAAHLAWHDKLENPCQPATTDAMKGFYLGPEFEQSEIEQCLKNADAQFEVLTEDELSDRTVEVLAQGCAVGWFNGRM